MRSTLRSFLPATVAISFLIACCTSCGSGGNGASAIAPSLLVPAASCGNGAVELGEECDDANLVTGDGCEPDCRTTPCIDLENLVPASPQSVVVARGTAGAGPVCGPIALDLRVTGLMDVFAFDFTLRFDPRVVRYDGFSTLNSFLGSDGTPIAAFPVERSGEVDFTVTRLGATGIDTAGSSFLMRLTFDIESVQDRTDLIFDGTRVIDGTAAPIPNVNWSGATFVVD